MEVQAPSDRRNAADRPIDKLVQGSVSVIAAMPAASSTFTIHCLTPGSVHDSLPDTDWVSG
jgi:hypothetical protein